MAITVTLKLKKKEGKRKKEGRKKNKQKNFEEKKEVGRKGRICLE